MRRSTTQDAAGRAANGISRGTIEKVDDTPKMQTASVRLFHGEQMTEVEHVHPYGFTAVPKAPDGDKKAEAFVVWQGSDRSHPMILAVGDRRYRLTGNQEGEVAIHDDQQQKVHITRNGIVVDAGPQKNPVNVTCGPVKAFIKKDRIDLGKDNATFRVMTEGGASNLVWAEVAVPTG